MASGTLISIVTFAMLGVGAGGAAVMATAHRETPAAPVAVAATSGPSHTYRDAVRSLDDAIASESARAQLDPTGWLVQGTLCSTYRSRAIVTGDTADYARAQRALDTAFQRAPRGAGPFLQRAQLHGSLHRWDLMEPDLQAVERNLPKTWERAAAIGLRGDYALQCGYYEQARVLLQQAADLDAGPSRLCALAELHNTTGDYHTADVLLDQADRTCPARDYPQRAWLLYERAVLVLARDDVPGAARWIALAQQAMPGWWRTDALAAAIDVRRGLTERAREINLRLVRATGNPQCMDALAHLARIRHDQDEASRWTNLAWAVYCQQLVGMPEAAGAHALDHVLDLTQDGALAVRLAEANHRMRPGGEATIQLARAYLLAGRITDARTTIRSVLDSAFALPSAQHTANAIETVARAADAARTPDLGASPP